jgi:hypothetical protein
MHAYLDFGPFCNLKCQLRVLDTWNFHSELGNGLPVRAACQSVRCDTVSGGESFQEADDLQKSHGFKRHNASKPEA